MSTFSFIVGDDVRSLVFNPKGWQTVAGGRSDSGDLRRRDENTRTPKAVPERRFSVPMQGHREIRLPRSGCAGPSSDRRDMVLCRQVFTIFGQHAGFTVHK